MSASKIKLHTGQALEAENRMNKHGRWRFRAVAGAVALLGSMVCLSAHALSLGRITVQSALGEPLRAEIDISDMTPQEASSLRAGLGSPEAFKAAGLEFSPVLTGVDVSLQKRADGRSYLRLRGNRPVNEPFVDLLIQTNSATGSLSRDYAVLVDPPTTRPNASNGNAVAAAPTAPQLSRPAAPAPAPRTRDAAPRPAAPRAEAVTRAPSAPAAASQPTAGDRQVTVKAGDTAGRIAAQNKPDGVSLDQMLVAMQLSNPDAFIGGNVNRIKSGALLNLPGSDAAGLVTAREASQTILAQSKDFNAFRRKLAGNVSGAQVAGADREAGGKVTARVEDKSAAGTTPDKLTLSKGAVQAKPGAATEEAIAKKRAESEASSRVAELNKNISELNKLGVNPAAPGAPAAAAAAGAAASAAKAPGLAVPAPSSMTTPTAPAAPAPAPTTAAASAPAAPQAAAPAPAPAASSVPATPAIAPSASTSASIPASPAASAAADTATPASGTGSSPVAAASEPSAVASVAATPSPAATARPTPAKAPEPQPRFIDDLLENPLVLPLAAGLLALLAGFGIYRYSRRNRSAAVDSSFLESRLQPDSFFGASGGQRIDTSESNVSGSSLVYSPSQLDAAGDVDPVAEADVYLAYGRDLQAEEILKEALRTSPTRVAIHSKLSEIYAKRRDSKAFETIANEAFKLTQGEGTEWSYISDMGRELDPTNLLYQPGGTGHGMAPVAAGAAAATAFTAAATPASPAPASAAKPDVDLDFDLDLSPAIEADPEDRNTSPAPFMAVPPAPVVTPPAPVMPDLDMDFSRISGNAPLTEARPNPGPSRFVDTYNMGATAVKSDSSPAAASTRGNATSPAPLNSGMLEFDLDSLSLDLTGTTTQNSSQTLATSVDDPLETKFSLAEEFRSLGDDEGARSLAEEVVAEARGPLKVKAQAFLKALA